MTKLRAAQVWIEVPPLLTETLNSFNGVWMCGIDPVMIFRNGVLQTPKLDYEFEAGSVRFKTHVATDELITGVGYAKANLGEDKSTR